MPLYILVISVLDMSVPFVYYLEVYWESKLGPHYSRRFRREAWI